MNIVQTQTVESTNKEYLTPFIRSHVGEEDQFDLQSSENDDNNNTQKTLFLHLKNTQVSLIDLKSEEILSENELYNSLEEQKDQQNIIFKFNDDQEQNKVNLPYVREFELSEISEQDLFTPKTNFIKTEVGSPLVDDFILNFNEIQSIKQLTFYDKFQNQNIQMIINQKTKFRRQKVSRYLQKKMNRTFKKRISYHSRKSVAETRLRIKGRFITKHQAQQILNIDLSNIPNIQIKQLLEIHFHQ